MKAVLLAGLALLLAVQAGAETYTWTDDNGTFNFTDDLSLVPQKYRKNVGKRGDAGVQVPAQPPASAPSAAGSEPKEKAVPASNGIVSGTPLTANGGLYDGKNAEAWQRQMGPLFGEVKRLEQELVQLEAQIKNPRGVSKESFSVLSQQFKETQGRYKEALKSYNDLNEAANKAGLPAEYRK